MVVVVVVGGGGGGVCVCVCVCVCKFRIQNQEVGTIHTLNFSTQGNKCCSAFKTVLNTYPFKPTGFPTPTNSRPPPPPPKTTTNKQ